MSFELKIGVAQELIDAVDAHNDRGSAARAGLANNLVSQTALACTLYHSPGAIPLRRA